MVEDREEAVGSQPVIRRNVLRRILLFGGIAAVAVGLLARQTGLVDTSHDRSDARRHLGNGVEALMSGELDLAQEEIQLAMAIDAQFAEASLTAALLSVALGDYQSAMRDAKRAMRLFEKHGVDAKGWGDLTPEAAVVKGLRIATRILCVSRVAAETDLKPSDHRRVLDFMRELSEVTDCARSRGVVERWRAEGRAFKVVIRARYDCPTLWPCSEAPEGAQPQ